ncbi:MAG: hypothetical protein KAH18_03990 [Psychromonas sp.]|nr:hypothetical protein [Psychromonas sp.]
MKRRLYNFCQDNFKVIKSGKIAYKALAKQLFNEYNFGKLDAGKLHFNEQDIEQLVKTIKSQTDGLHLFRDTFTEMKNRINVAKLNINEKQNSISINKEYVLLNSLKSININQQQCPIVSMRSLGVNVAIDEIKSIEHSHLIMVENLIIMAYLTKLDLPHELDNALWLYRGDIKDENNTGAAYDVFRQYKQKIELICFSDLDPQGIIIALGSGADLWLTVNDPHSKSLPKGIDNDFYKQDKACKSLSRRNDLPKSCQRAFDNMCVTKKTIKQEHMVSEQFELGCFSLISAKV